MTGRDELLNATVAAGVAEAIADVVNEEMAKRKGKAKRQAKRQSPTSRSLAECRKRGWPAGVVEKFVKFPPPGHHVDLFGVIDVVGLVTDDESGVRCIATIGIQACAGSGHGARRAKILAEPRARQWIEAGNRLELWSWSKRGAHFERGRWVLRVEVFTLDSAFTIDSAWSPPSGHEVAEDVDAAADDGAHDGDRDQHGDQSE